MKYHPFFNKHTFYTSLLVLSLGCTEKKTAIVKAAIPAPQIARMSGNLYGFVVNEDSKVEKAKLGRNQSFASFLSAHKIDTDKIKELLCQATAYMDVSKIQAGKNLTFVKERENDDVHYFVYEKSKSEYVVFDLRDTVNVFEQKKEVQTLRREVAVQINGSIFHSLEEAGLNPDIATRTADILQYSFDFFKIKKGDIFRVVFDEVMCGGKSMGISDIYAISFVHGGKEFQAYRYQKENLQEKEAKVEKMIAGDTEKTKSKDKKSKKKETTVSADIPTERQLFYDENGNSLRRAFLKAPLKFTRVSSGFSTSRFHPILKIYRAHNGIDYAAPTGTPIHTLGDGVIEEIGYGGGNGNYIKVKHNKTYTTQYLHMSKFAEGMKKGKRITQGDVIGYVGSTGLATGPHLCFRFWKDGVQVNPADHLKDTKADPIPAKEKAAYLKFVEEMRAKMQEAKLISGKAMASL